MPWWASRPSWDCDRPGRAPARGGRRRGQVVGAPGARGAAPAARAGRAPAVTRAARAPGQPAGHPREWDAATYHRVSAPQHAWGLRVLDRLALRGGERVLDAGCGTGRVTL